MAAAACACRRGEEEGGGKWLWGSMLLILNWLELIHKFFPAPILSPHWLTACGEAPTWRPCQTAVPCRPADRPAACGSSAHRAAGRCCAQRRGAVARPPPRLVGCSIRVGVGRADAGERGRSSEVCVLVQAARRQTNGRSRRLQSPPQPTRPAARWSWRSSIAAGKWPRCWASAVPSGGSAAEAGGRQEGGNAGIAAEAAEAAQAVGSR